MTRRGALVFVGRRLAAMALLLVILSFAVFSLVYIAPGDAVSAYVGQRRIGPEEIARLRAELRLDEPFLAQYWYWARDALVLDFGSSTQTTLPVSDEIQRRLGTSLFLGVYAYVLSLLLGMIPGMVAALHRRRAVDRGLVAGSVLMLSTPPFVLGILMLFLFAVTVPIFPVAGVGEGFWDQLWHMTLPALALALSIAAFLLRHTRAAVINVLDQDYVMFARARGLPWRRILLRYALRNALIPVVTVSGALLTYFITGAVLVESTFSINGLGALLVQSAQSGDLPMVQGLALLMAVLIVSANLLADLAYVAIDPRIRLGKGGS